MREIDKRTTVRRRVLLRGAATAAPAAAVASAGLLEAGAAWAQKAVNLKPGTMVTLAKVARDIFPHDRVPDRFYVAAIRPYDDKAGTNSDLRSLLEGGVENLDKAAAERFGVRGGYVALNWEHDRVPLLEAITGTPFFKQVRSDLVVSFYNQPELWPRFGYEGPSYEKGGYIERGFNDIDWLPQS